MKTRMPTGTTTSSLSEGATPSISMSRSTSTTASNTPSPATLSATASPHAVVASDGVPRAGGAGGAGCARTDVVPASLRGRGAPRDYWVIDHSSVSDTSGTAGAGLSSHRITCASCQPRRWATCTRAGYLGLTHWPVQPSGVRPGRVQRGRHQLRRLCYCAAITARGAGRARGGARGGVAGGAVGNHGAGRGQNHHSERARRGAAHDAGGHAACATRLRALLAALCPGGRRRRRRAGAERRAGGR
jgi:hypothetical protein